MTQKCSGFTKKKALILVLGLGVLILLLIVLRAVFAPGTEFDLSTLDGREAFLNSLGWEIDKSTEEFRTVVVPDKLEGIMARSITGCSRRRDMTSPITSANGAANIAISLQITLTPTVPSSSPSTFRKNEVIAGDIHTTAVNGFMHGLKRNAQPQK